MVAASLRRSSQALAVLFVGGAVALGLSVLTSVGEVFASVATRSGCGISTLGGRTDSFHYPIGCWSKSPVLGYGHGAGARSLPVDFDKRAGLVDLDLFGAIGQWCIVGARLETLSAAFFALTGTAFALGRTLRCATNRLYAASDRPAPPWLHRGTPAATCEASIRRPGRPL